MAHKSGAFHLDSSDEKLEVSVTESDTDFTVDIVATLNGRLSDLTFIYCRTADQVRALVPGFRSEAEKAAEVTTTPEAPVVARPYQVGDKVRVLRVSGITDEPYESQVISTDFSEGHILVRSQSDEHGWDYRGRQVWEVSPEDLELIAPAEATQAPA